MTIDYTMSNEDYHANPALSKSTLDLIAKDPALVEWSRKAPRLPSPTLEIGTAVHTALLEPQHFASRYAVAPEVDKRTKDGKAAWEEFEMDARLMGKHVLSADEYAKIPAMRDSVHAHPTARSLLQGEGVAEASLFWTDPATGLACRCRPDFWLTGENVFVDVKTTGDMERFGQSVIDYRYHVQQAFYSDGFAALHDGERLERFVFVVVSTAVSAGRYPVRVFELTKTDVEIGRHLYRQDLQRYEKYLAGIGRTEAESLPLAKWYTDKFTFLTNDFE